MAEKFNDNNDGRKEEPFTKGQKIEELNALEKSELIEQILDLRELLGKVLIINEQLERMLKQRLLS